ncbi:MAG: response regulator [Gemmataceae bacterium]|nr:response regulator [Gemmataceae bacterium]
MSTLLPPNGATLTDGAPKPAKPAKQATPGEDNRLYNAGEVRILVLDDDPAIGRLIDAALAQYRFTIDMISDPTQMENQIMAAPYNLIVLDYVLPGLDSKKVMELIQMHQPDASVIVITAFPSMDSALHCLRSHTYDYITKPFQVELLQKTVVRCLESRGLMRLSEEALREQLGAAIRERRKSLGLTLADLAKRTSVSLGYLSQIELGKNSASIETLYRIALGLRVRVADLFQAIQASI